MTKALADYPGKETLMLIVEYPPGAVDPVHRHNAYGFIYVLEGSIVMLSNFPLQAHVLLLCAHG